MGTMFRAAIPFIARPRLAVISALTWGTISDCPPVGAARLSVGAANQSKRKQTCNNDLQHFLLLRLVTKILKLRFIDSVIPANRNSHPFIGNRPSMHRQTSVIGALLFHEAISTERRLVRMRGPFS